MPPFSDSSTLCPDPQSALSQAEHWCRRRGSRLTELRRRVLEIIWTSPIPIGAYAILDVLRADGRPGAPPTVYRTLDFLLEEGLIHRLASLNVFTGCRRPGHEPGGQFLICRDCGQVVELANQAVECLLRAEAQAHDFEVLTQMVEVLGWCPDCRQGATVHGG